VTIADGVAVGTLAHGVLARVDTGGSVTMTSVTSMANGRTLSWYIAADDRWHTPSREAAVRQRLVDGVPVVETVVRVPGGDAIQRAYAVPDLGGLVVMEIENATTLPFAVAFDSGDLLTSRSPADVPIEGIDLPAGSIVMPVGKTSRVWVACGGGRGALPAVPTAADVVRGWTQTLDRSPRLTLPDDGVMAGVRSARAALLLAPAPSFDRGGDLVEFVLVVSEHVRLGEPAEPWVDDIAEAAVRIAKASRSVADPHTDVALRRAADVLRAAGQDRAAADVEAMPLGAAGSAGSLGTGSLGTGSLGTGSLGTGSLGTGSLGTRSSAVRMLVDSLDSWASGRGRNVELVTAGIPAELLGQSFDVNDARAGEAVVSYAVRWHGERPAVLWESSVPITVRCSVVDPSWQAEGTRGDALLVAPRPEAIR
jgi:hypothetical protein